MSRVFDRSRPGHRRRRGAIQLAVPSALIVTALVGALAIDVGRMAWRKRELQAVVDLAAIDTLRSFGRCREDAGDPLAAAQASALRNGYTGSLGVAPNAVEIGSVTTVDGVRRFTAGGAAATATAVRVFATRSVPFTLIAGAFLPDWALLRAEAVASRDALAGLRVGSFAARVDSGDGPLLDQLFTALLGGSVSLDAVSYQNLAGANLKVGDLVAAASVGTIDELLALELSGPAYLELLAAALSQAGNAGAAATLSAIASIADASLLVPLSEVLEIDASRDDAALEAELNAYDLLDVGAQVANGDAAVLVDPLNVTLPGVASTAMRLKIVEPPRIAVGPPGRDEDGSWRTSVRTAQVRMALELRLSGVLGMLGSQPVSLDLFVEAAQTFAHLDAIDCADASDPVHRVVVGAEPGLARLGIGRYPDFESSPLPEPSPVVRLKVFGVPIADVTAAADVPFQSSVQELRFAGPFVPALAVPSEDNTQTVGTPLGEGLSNALGALLGDTELEVELLGAAPLPVSNTTVLTAVAGLLQPVLTALDAPLTTLFEALGITLGGADITVLSLAVDPPGLAR